MNKSQLRSDLLNESAPFVANTSRNNKQNWKPIPSAYISQNPDQYNHGGNHGLQHQHGQNFPQQNVSKPMKYVKHPLQQQQQQQQAQAQPQQRPPQHQHPSQDQQYYNNHNSYNQGIPQSQQNNYNKHNTSQPQHQPSQSQYEPRGSYNSYHQDQQYGYQQQAPPPQQQMRSQSYSYVQPPYVPDQQRYQSQPQFQPQPQSQPQPQPQLQYQQQQQQQYSQPQARSVSQPVQFSNQPLNPHNPIFASSDENLYESPHVPPSNGSHNPANPDMQTIKQLEEQVQRLQLEMKSLKSQSRTFEPLESPVSVNSALESTSNRSDLISTQNGAPPLPPPPPQELRSSTTSPIIKVYSHEEANTTNVPATSNVTASHKQLSTVATEEARESVSSFIPTNKSLEDLEQDDVDDDDEPPPSYEELEKSGSLTYSQSIYRTGFEKAGYQMDHISTSVKKPSKLSVDSSNFNIDSAGGAKYNDKEKAALNELRDLNIKKRVKESSASKRKIPPSIMEHAESSATSIPTLQSASTVCEKPLQPTSMREGTTPAPLSKRQQSMFSEVPLPLPLSQPNTQFDAYSLQQKPTQATSYAVTKPTATLSTTNEQHKSPPVSSAPVQNILQSKSYNASKVNDSTPVLSLTVFRNVIKYSTEASFEKLPNGVIKPILPSKSTESPELIINRFIRTREKALQDYKTFTPRIQFDWAIVLLETMCNSAVLSKMSIDGKLRKTELSFKKLTKTRVLFFRTAIKVLEKIIEIAPDLTRARLYLGDIYSGGIHPGLIEKNERLGYKLFYEAAVKQSDPVACYRVACCLESGIGCEKNIAQSIYFYEQGANLGDPSSMSQAGIMYFNGDKNCVQNVQLSISFFKKAYDTLKSEFIMAYDPLISSRSYVDALGSLYTLAKLYQTDKQILLLTDLTDYKTMKTINELKSLNVWCNSPKALKYYLEAAKLGHDESQACLGYFYSQGYFPTCNFKSDKESQHNKQFQINSRKSIYWFSQAASSGHTYASLGLARWYGSGAIEEETGKVILKRDEQQAFLWGRKAADSGELAEAEFMIGVCFEEGFGVEKNLIMAANYFQRSARKGYKKASAKLKSLR